MIKSWIAFSFFSFLLAYYFNASISSPRTSLYWDGKLILCNLDYKSNLVGLVGGIVGLLISRDRDNILHCYCYYYLGWISLGA